MLILVTCPPSENIAATAASKNVRYWPDLAEAAPDTVAGALASLKPDVVVTRRAVAPAALAAWRAARPGAPLLIVGTADGGGASEHNIRYCRTGDTTGALALAEQIWNEMVSTPPPTRRPAARSVTLVGAGIVNLVTALRLARHGYDVTVYEGSPDPRRNADWTAYGCTRGGGDGRMFTLTEADSYNGRARRPDGTSNDLLFRPISDHGWLVSKPGDLVARERRWAQDFHRIPPWLASSYNADIFAVNQAARAQWEGLIASDPELFDDHTGYREGILRLYTELDYFRWHIARNDRAGAIRQILSPDQVRACYPALEEACAAGTVVGGINVVGFTVNIHKFLAHLVSTLEIEGVRFQWNSPATGVHWAEAGIADGLDTATGTIRSQHYVLSPGAYGDQLLQGTAAHGQIQGMLGVWLTVPNIEPQLMNSVKIARQGHRAEETNVTLATDRSGGPALVCGAGYGWTGLDPHNIDTDELEELFDALEDTIRQFFPRAHAAAQAAHTLDASRQLCVRPWTASCLGVFEQIPTREGGLLLVTGGHNTGGFAQSPVVADAVLAAVEGRTHRMHTRYHPLRLERFYG